MFYLMQLFRTIEKNLFSGISFLLLSVLLLTTLAQRDFIQKRVFNKLPTNVNGPYFYALVSGQENHSRISRKLTTLPGVAVVNILEKEEVQSKVQEILTSLGMSGGSSLFDFNYAGLKIVLKEGVSTRSQSLIRDYLKRLVGTSKVTLGATKQNDDLVKKHTSLVKAFKKWGTTLTLSLIFTLWLWSGICLSRHIRETSFIVENFQRRKHVGLKTYGAGVLFIGLLSLSALAWGTPSFISFTIGLTMLATFGVQFLSSFKRV